MIVAAVALVIVGVSASSFMSVLAGGVIGATALFILPRNSLPAITLWLVVLVPVGFIDATASIGRFVSLGVIALLIWMVRFLFADGTDFLQQRLTGWLIVVPFLVLLVISILLSGEHPVVMLMWSAVFVLCTIAPALIGQASREDIWPSVQSAFAGIGIFLGLVASVEFFFHFNPWESVFRQNLVMQTWSVFRAKTSLGHPLTTSLVASVALVVSIFPSRSTRKWLFRLGAAGATAAVLLSVARVGVAAVGAAVVIGVFSARPKDRQSLARGAGGLGRRLAALIVVAATIALITLSPLLKLRNSSEEGLESVYMRSRIYANAIRLVSERPVFGFGPGLSSFIYEGRFRRLSIENAALQLTVSLGLPAFLLVLLGAGVLVGVAMRRSRPGVAAGIVAFLVSLTGYNAVDTNPALLALLGPLIFCAVSPAITDVSCDPMGEAPELSRRDRSSNGRARAPRSV